MDSRSDIFETDVDALKNKIQELERQLAEANAAIQAMMAEQNGVGNNQLEKQEAETELEQDRARFQAIFNSLTEGVVIFDLDGNVLDVNPAALKITGYASVEESQRNLMEFPDTLEVFSLDGKQLPSEWPRLRLNGETFTGLEFEIRRKDTGGFDRASAAHSSALPRGPFWALTCRHHRAKKADRGSGALKPSSSGRKIASSPGTLYFNYDDLMPTRSAGQWGLPHDRLCTGEVKNRTSSLRTGPSGSTGKCGCSAM
jgi:PAS domain S-box-containing protein